jgi:hypothetical protein
MEFREKVKTFNDFLPQELFNAAYMFLQETQKWGFNRSKANDEFAFFGMHLDNVRLFCDDIYSLVRQKVGEEYKIYKILANAQSFSQDGKPHYDSDQTNTKTFIIYMNPQWDYMWGGETILFDRYREGEETNVLSDQTLHFYPLPNSAILFPSNMYHFGTGPKKTFSGFRLSIAYHLVV